jgi:hypothetical protein
MALQRAYRSKIDGKVGLVSGLAVLVLIVAAVTLPDRDHPGALALHVVGLIGLAVCVWTLLGTYYVVDATALIVRSGPFHWIVPLREIRSVQPTRDIRSGPALSFDRLRIEFGGGRVILISPREKAEFLADLARRGVQGIRATE